MNMALRQTEMRIISPGLPSRRAAPPLMDRGMPPRSFLVIESQAMVRHGLALSLLAACPGGAAHEAADIDSALTLAAQSLARPVGGRAGGFDLIVVDLAALPGNPEAGLRRLTRLVGPVPIVVTSSTQDIVAARQCLASGAKAFLLKTDSNAVLEHTVALILSGEGYVPLPAWMLPVQRAAPRPGPGAENPLGRLTARQREIFALLLSGCSNKEIARSLGVLEGTVKVHVRAMMQKLGATNRTQVAVMAARCGLRADA